MKRLCTGIGAAVLAAQAILLVRARLVDDRYFCWAPLHEEARYQLQVSVGGRLLPQRAALARYHLGGLHPSPGPDMTWELNSIRHVMEIIRAYETTVGAADAAQVTLVYRINGGEEATWDWPPR